MNDEKQDIYMVPSIKRENIPLWGRNLGATNTGINNKHHDWCDATWGQQHRLLSIFVKNVQPNKS